MCKQRVFRVGGNDHRIAPDIRALVWHGEAHFLILVKNNGGIPGIDDGDVLIACHHRVDDFVGDVDGRHGVVHLAQPVVGGVDLGGIIGVHRAAECLERHHKRVALGVIDVDATGVVRVAQDLPALGFHRGGVDVLVVIDKTHTAPEVGDGPGIVGVIIHILHRRREIIQIRNERAVELLEIVACDETLDHVIRGDQHVVAVAGLDLGVHHLVGVKVFHNDLDAELTFKVGDQVFADVFAGEIELERVGAVFFDGGLAPVLPADAAAGNTADDRDRQNAGGYGDRPAGKCKAFFLACSLLVQDRNEVDDAQHKRDQKDHDGRERVDRRIDALGHRIDQNGDVVHAVACDEVGNDEVVKAHRERDQRAGDDAGTDLRNDDLRERLKRRCAQIHCCVDEVGVERAQLRRDRKHDIGDTEHDMRDEQRSEALSHGKNAEEHQKRNCRHDIGVHHGEVVHALDHRLQDLFAFGKTDGRDCADHGGHDGRQHCDHNGVEHRFHHRRVGEHLFIPAQTEAAEFGERAGVVE